MQAQRIFVTSLLLLALTTGHLLALQTHSSSRTTSSTVGPQNSAADDLLFTHRDCIAALAAESPEPSLWQHFVDALLSLTHLQRSEVDVLRNVHTHLLSLADKKRALLAAVQSAIALQSQKGWKDVSRDRVPQLEREVAACLTDLRELLNGISQFSLDQAFGTMLSSLTERGAVACEIGEIAQLPFPLERITDQRLTRLQERLQQDAASLHDADSKLASYLSKKYDHDR